MKRRKAMKHFLSLTLFLVLLASFFGCSSRTKGLQTASEEDIPIPIWYKNPPKSADYLYAAYKADSKDMQMAIDKALSGARKEIGLQVEFRMNALQRRVDEEVGIGKDAQLLQLFTQASEIVVSTSISGSRIKEQEIFKVGDSYYAFVLVEYPIGAANQAFLEQLKRSEQLYTRLRSSQILKELNEKAEKYEKEKQEQWNK